MVALFLTIVLSLPLPNNYCLPAQHIQEVYTPYRFYTNEYVDFILDSLPPIEPIDIWEEIMLEEFWDTQV